MGKQNWSYTAQIDNLFTFNNLCSNDNISEREAANTLEVPRSTLRYWNQQSGSILIPTSIQNALLTHEGLVFLHRLQTALQYVITQTNKIGIRAVELFLSLTGLDTFIASSYGVLQNRGIAMEEHINEFGEDQIKSLSKDMPHQNISIAKDETFNKNNPFLVAIEPVSDFILTEKRTDTRTENDWHEALEEKLSALNVNIIQNVNDAGSAIEKYNSLHHPAANDSPDLYHLLNKLHQSIVGPLSSKKRSQEKQLENLSKGLSHNNNRIKELSSKNNALKHREDKLRAHVVEKRDRENRKMAVRNALSKIEKWDKAYRQAIANISELYHPYDLESGEIRLPEALDKALKKELSIISTIAEEMELSDKSKRRIARVSKYITLMVSTMRFYFNEAENVIEVSDLSLDNEKLLKDHLLPIAYLTIAGNKKQVAQDRHAIMATVMHLENDLNKNTIWNKKTESEQENMIALSKHIANIFQRSSSCVEGRNSHLTRWHHGVGSISQRKLSALTVVHNFGVKRSDGTTAAERFFGKKHNDLFEWILTKMPLPLRSNKKIMQGKCSMDK